MTQDDAVNGAVNDADVNHAVKSCSQAEHLDAVACMSQQVLEFNVAVNRAVNFTVYDGTMQ